MVTLAVLQAPLTSLCWRLPAGLRELYSVSRSSLFLGEYEVRDPVSAAEATNELRRTLGDENRPWQTTPERHLAWVQASRRSVQQLVFEPDADLPGRVFMFDAYPDFSEDDQDPDEMWLLIGHDTESYLSSLCEFVETGYLRVEEVTETARGVRPQIRWSDDVGGHGYATMNDANSEVAEILRRYDLHQIA